MRTTTGQAEGEEAEVNHHETTGNATTKATREWEK